MTQGISCPAFHSITIVKLYNIPVTPMVVKKVITNLDLSDSPDCIPVLVLNKREPELSYIIAKLFNMCLEEILFSRLLKGLIGCPCIKECWGEVYGKNLLPC